MKSKTNAFALIMAFVLLTLCTCSFAFGQEAKTTKKYDEVRGYLMLGGNQLDIDALNDRLESKGYASFPDEFFSIGIGFLRKTKYGWLYGAEGNVLVVDEKDTAMPNGNHTASLIAGNGFFNLGYALISTGGLNIFPLAGLGLGISKLSIGKNNFDDILVDSEHNAELFTAAFALNFALGMDYLLKMKDNKKGEGFVFGFRAGYTYTPWEAGWQTEMFGIDNGPKTGMTGPYVRLLIGFGGMSE